MNIKIVAIIFIFINNFRVCQCIKYKNYSLYNVVPTEPEHLQFLQNLDHKKYINVIFWKKPYKLFESVQLIVNPKDEKLFIERTQHYNLQTELLINDIERAFNNQIVKLRTKTFKWNFYRTLDDIYQWLADMAATYPKKVELVSIGKSAEGRDILVMSFKADCLKAGVIIEGGIHGNEWISVEVVTYLLYQLLTNVNKNKQLSQLLKQYKWHVIPIVNPDGYVYSQTTDRLWRKNRRQLKNNVGVDLNRNFNYSFGTFGTTDDEKDDYFCGPDPLSEPESKALADFIFHNKNDLRFYFSFHSYGQKIIIPYADRIRHIDNYAQAEHFGKKAIAKMYAVHGIKYTIGSNYDTLGLRISGNSGSYVKKTYDVKYVYTFLLRDNGSYGHALPTEQILPTCQESLAGIVELMTMTQKKMSLMSGSQQLTISILCSFIRLLLFYNTFL